MSASVVALRSTADTCRSHVAKTDDIKDFVITEESSIAKGIRRIVALTGFDANEVSRKAKDFENRLERANGMQGKDKEAALKAFYTVRMLPRIRVGTADLGSGAGSEQYLVDPETATQGKVRKDSERASCDRTSKGEGRSEDCKLTRTRARLSSSDRRSRMKYKSTLTRTRTRMSLSASSDSVPTPRSAIPCVTDFPSS